MLGHTTMGISPLRHGNRVKASSQARNSFGLLRFTRFACCRQGSFSHRQYSFHPQEPQPLLYHTNPGLHPQKNVASERSQQPSLHEERYVNEGPRNSFIPSEGREHFQGSSHIVNGERNWHTQQFRDDTMVRGYRQGSYSGRGYSWGRGNVKGRGRFG